MTPFGIRKKLKSLMGMEEKAPPPEVQKFPVTFLLPDGSEFETYAKEGDSLVLASGRGSSPISTGCADCSCSVCKVEVIEGLESLTPENSREKWCKEENKTESAFRLGCQAGVIGPGVKVKIINVFGEEPI